MHLKTLSLRGFKSFASATTLRLEPGITCVVGPNGSGKSNVVDALAWVMGEQGAKTLRGANMADVIFAGTSGRAPLGRAQVDLTIDNSDGLLPIDYSEVTISRTLFRGGGSEYAINGTPARLLDIQELLSDTGMGRQMHVIVGQGQLDTILSSTPEERRGFIEEAAGVLKHRRRKERALKKLGDMDQNLVRVLDLTSEIERQLRPLARQAKIARRASLIQARVRDAKARLLADDLVIARDRLQRGSDDADVQHERLAQLQEEERLRGADIRRLEEEERLRHPQVAQAMEEWQSLTAIVQRLDATMTIARERVLTHSQPELAPQTEDPASLDERAQAASHEDAQILQRVQSAQSRVDEALRLRGEAERLDDEAQRALAQANRLLADYREASARLSAGLASASSRFDAAQAEAKRAKTQVDAAREREAKAAQEAQAYSEDHPSNDSLASKALNAAQKTREEAREKVDALLALERDARAERARWEARRDALAQTLTPSDGTASFMEAKGSMGDLPSGVHVDAGYENAIAQLLFPFSDALVMDTREHAWENVRDANERGQGQVRFLIADCAATHRKPVPLEGIPGKWARDAVTSERFSALLDVLLDGAWVSQTIEEARIAIARPEIECVATARGDLVTNSSVLVAGEESASPLALRAQYEEAAAAAAEALKRESDAQEQLSEANAALDQAVRGANDALKALREEDARQAKIAQEAARVHSGARAAHAETTRAEETLKRAEEQLEHARIAHENAQERARTGALEAPDVDLEAATRLAEERAAAARAAREEETQARLALRAAEEESRGAASRARNLRQAAARSREERIAYQRREERRKRELARAQSVLEEAQRGFEYAQRAVAAAKGRRDAIEVARREDSEKLAGVRAQLDAVRAQISELTLASQQAQILRAELRMRVEQLEGRSLEEISMEADDLIEHYGPHNLVPILTEDALNQISPEDVESNEEGQPAQETEDSVPSRPYVREEQVKVLDQALKELEKLGRVNPLALEEHAALAKRHEFLVAQVHDLKKSKADLLHIVEDVDRLVQEAFEEAWKDTAKHFEHTFNVLFPGGEGHLVLTDPDSMLDTGIEIEARPAGKKVKRLSLLSGGERSLAALAFLVAIFKARPSPFYVMDEVEAALDDINLSRLLEIFKELRATSQLIVITHQKRTMEIADALYGVTMRDGVTRVVSQRLNE